jgi:hypothetical protein
MPADLIKPSTALADIFSAYERVRIEVFRRFLVMMVSPDIAPRAAELGYTSSEHAEAWLKLDTIDGRGLTFDDALRVARREALLQASPVLKAQLRYIDQQENRWFERVRKAIPRFIGPADIEAFQSAFWQDLAQEPEGPGVLGSMTKFCDRLESLATNPTPGAKELHDSLALRGFHAAMIADLRARITICRKEMPESPAPLDNEAKLQQVAAERRDAYQWLNAFYNDWATTLRTELTYHQAVRLGITEVKGGRQPASDTPAPTEGDVP